MPAKAILGVLLLALLPQGAASASEVSVLRVGSEDELHRTFCVADLRRDHILILPAALFVDAAEMICDEGPYKLYRVVAPADPGDFLYFIDPPFGTTGRLACDGKAGRSMAVIAVNCRPV